MGLKPYASIKEQRSNSVNEVVSLVTLQFLILFTGQFVQDKLQLHNTAIMIIVITVINFIINAIPIAVKVHLCIRHAIKKIKEKLRRR